MYCMLAEVKGKASNVLWCAKCTTEGGHCILWLTKELARARAIFFARRGAELEQRRRRCGFSINILFCLQASPRPGMHHSVSLVELQSKVKYCWIVSNIWDGEGVDGHELHALDLNYKQNQYNKSLSISLASTTTSQYATLYLFLIYISLGCLQA